MPKFDVCIQNPPFKRQLHLKFLELGFNLLNETGKMVIIEPSNWLGLLRTTGAAKKYYQLKNTIGQFIESVKMNWADALGFNISNYTPLAIIYINKNKNNKKISFKYINEAEKILNNINDINYIGKYNIIKSIENKSKTNYKLVNFINNNKLKYFVNISGLVGNGFMETVFYDGIKRKFQNRYNFVNNTTNKVTFDVLRAKPQKGKEIGNLKQYISFKSEQEANNFLKYLTKTKFIKYLAIAYNLDQHLESMFYLVPWLDFKNEWSDDKINSYFNFNKEEINLINITIVKMSTT